MTRFLKKISSVKKLKWQFLLFGFVLCLVLGLFTTHARLQIREQQIATYQKIAEGVYNQLQARISDFLVIEDAKPFSSYRFDMQESALNDEETDKGFLGYFEIDPSGEFRSQFSDVLVVDTKQKIQHQKLKNITQNLLQKKQGQDQGDDLKFLQLNLPLQQDETKQTNKDNSPNLKTPESDATDITYSKIDTKSAKKSFYPNPLQRSTKKIPDGEEFEQTQQTQSPTPAQKITVPSEDWLNLPKLNATEMTDPFQARWIADKYLLFYRKAWVQNRVHVQGFALDGPKFLDWLLQQSYDDSLLQSFTSGRISIGKNVVHYFGQSSRQNTAHRTLFQRPLGYPLSLMEFRLMYNALPLSVSEQFLFVLSGLTILTLLVALFFIYKSVVGQIVLAGKKEDFVAAITHELKTPLTSIRLSSEILNQGFLKEPEKISRHHKMILKETERLSRLIENVLSVSRLEKKKQQLVLKEHSPTQDFVEFAREFRALVEDEGFVWRDHIANDLPTIFYDQDAMKQILWNLIENSLKFGKNHPKQIIEMRAFTQGTFIVLEIRDHGPGVPPQDLEKIFEKFYRVENELTRKTKGSGIGLSLVKSLAEQMGAKITARNHKDSGLIISLFLTQSFSLSHEHLP